MRNYQQKKNNPYKLPHNLYMRMLYLVRDYERIRSEREDILNASPAPDGTPHSGTGNPTEQKAIKLAGLGIYLHKLACGDIFVANCHQSL